MLETGQTNSLHPCTLNSNTEESKEGRRIKAQMRLFTLSSVLGRKTGPGPHDRQWLGQLCTGAGRVSLGVALELRPGDKLGLPRGLSHRQALA